MKAPSTPDDLPQVCWCDTQVRYTTPAAVWAGEGWSCKPGVCEPGCVPGAGLTPRGKAGTSTARKRAA